MAMKCCGVLSGSLILCGVVVVLVQLIRMVRYSRHAPLVVCCAFLMSCSIGRSCSHHHPRCLRSRRRRCVTEVKRGKSWHGDAPREPQMTRTSLLLFMMGCSPSGQKSPTDSGRFESHGGQSCWDLDGDGVEDAEEDSNADGVVDVFDCRGVAGADGVDGSDGLDCWDSNGNGEPDASEDLNGDGFVDHLDCGTSEDGELEYFLGSVTISSEAAAEFFCERYNGVYGDLRVEGPPAVVLNIDCLEYVERDLFLLPEPTAASDYVFPHLFAVGGGIEAWVSGAAEFPVLTDVGGRLILRADASEGDAGFSAAVLEVVGSSSASSNHVILSSVDGESGPASTGTSSYFSFSSLHTIYGDLDVAGSKGMQTLSGLSTLRTISNDLSIYDSMQLEDVTHLHGLETVNGRVIITRNPVLASADAYALVDAIEYVGGEVIVSDNGSE